MTSPRPLEGLRVLVVEDEFLLAMTVSDDLEGHGCRVVGPFYRLETAMAAAASEPFDVALLDINLNGTMVFPLADDLIGRGLPVVFVSGYGAAQLPERFRKVRRVAKPHDQAALLNAIRASTGR